MKGGAFIIIALTVIRAILSFAPDPSLSRTYNIHGPLIAPNVVSAVLFDFRGYDTLGECIILVAAVLALSMLYGRGLIKKDHGGGKMPDIPTTGILEPFTFAIAPILLATGIMITLGGHISPGGGFQGGAIIAVALFSSIVLLGAKKPRISHSSLLRLESLGLLAYLILGVFGLHMGGHYLYNMGYDILDTGARMSWIFNYPDIYEPGVIPYLNIAVMLKVSAGIATALIIILEGRR